MWPLTNNKKDRSSSSPMFDAAWKIRTQINKICSSEPCQVITVTSAGDGEGKTVTAINVACAYAQIKKSVVIIDANLRKPSLHKVFSLSNRSGLFNVLSENYEYKELVRYSGIPNLDLVTSGPDLVHPVELLTSHQMAYFIDRLKKEYDVIIIDTPSALEWSDAQIAASLSEGVLLVMKSGKVTQDNAVKVKDLMGQVNARMLGAVLNAAN